MSILTLDRKGKKALLTDNSKAVKTALKSLQGVQREIDEQNNGILNSLLNIDPNDIDDQPAIIRHAVTDIREEVQQDRRDITDDVGGALKCRIKNCHRDITFYLWKRLYNTLMMVMPTLNGQKKSSLNTSVCTAQNV